MENRNRTIIRTSIIGILVNICLAAFKAFLGILTNSIAITLDAINNLSDAMSSVITVAGTRLAAKPADREHPFGYGRIEYLSTIVIAGIILYAGISSLIEAVSAILHPEESSYDTVAFLLLAVALIVKILLGSYFQKVGKKTESDSLVMSGKEAMLDAVVSGLTIVAAVVYMLFQVSLEAWVGAIISILIIKAGIETLKDTIDSLLGQRADKELVQEVKRFVAHFSHVHGAYDLVLNDYGPEKYVGSIHVAIDDVMSAAEIDELIREIQRQVEEKFPIHLSAIGIYSTNTHNKELMEIEKQIGHVVKKHEDVLSMHGFYFNAEKKRMSFDIVISFSSKDAEGTYRSIMEELTRMYPGFEISIQRDIDFSD